MVTLPVACDRIVNNRDDPTDQCTRERTVKEADKRAQHAHFVARKIVPKQSQGGTNSRLARRRTAEDQPNRDQKQERSTGETEDH